MMCKVCSVVVNCRLKRSVVIHDALHGFREGRGTATTTAMLEAKLDQQLAGISHDTIFQVFIYVRKAYESLGRKRIFILPIQILNHSYQSFPISCIRLFNPYSQHSRYLGHKHSSYY